MVSFVKQNLRTKKTSSWSNLVRDSERVSRRKRTWSDLVEGSGVDMEEKQEKQEERDNKKVLYVLADISKRNNVVFGNGLVTI